MNMTLIEETESIRNGMIAKIPKEETEKVKAIIQRTMKIRRETMKIRKEPEVLLEGIDPIEMTENTKGVITAQRGGKTPAEENPALIEGNMPLREGADGTIALKKGEKEAEGNILLRKGGDTLGKRGEGVARDPMVQEDP